MTATIRAAYYGRVSTDGQVEGTSLDGQRERCLAEIKRKGWVLAGEYVDEGVSGAKGNRPQLDRLMADCHAKEVQAVVVAKLDRFGRSMRHLARLLGELDDLEVAFVSVAEAFDSSTSSGRLQRNILSSFADFERDQIRERTTAGKMAVLEKGGWWGGPPYGYKLVERPQDKHKELAIDDREAEMLRLAVGLIVDEGKGTGEAAKVLNALGYLPRRAKGWTYVTLRRMLRDARITGDWSFGRPAGWERDDNAARFGSRSSRSSARSGTRHSGPPST